MDLQSKAFSYVSSFPSMSNAVQNANSVFDQKYFQARKNLIWQDLLPGRIYTFDYELPSDQMTLGGFIDRRPIAAIIPPPGGYPRMSLFGLDLNLLPPSKRSTFISKYSDVIGTRFGEDGVENLEESEEKSSRLNLNSASMLTPDFPISRIVKGFDVTYISGFIKIEMSDWYLLPYLNDFVIQGTTINRIYNQ
jgi:hypothetical protein